MKLEWKWFTRSGILDGKSPHEKRDAFMRLQDKKIKSHINEIDPDGRIQDVDLLLRKLNEKFVSKLEIPMTLKKKKKSRKTSSKHP